MAVQQDIPIKLLSASQLAQFNEPHLPEPEVYIMVPPLKLLRNVVDRMKNIHDYLGISANMGGELTLKVETDMVSIATFYTNLHHPQIGTRLRLIHSANFLGKRVEVLRDTTLRKWQKWRWISKSLRNSCTAIKSVPPTSYCVRTSEVGTHSKLTLYVLFAGIVENTAVVLHVLLEVRVWYILSLTNWPPPSTRTFTLPTIFPLFYRVDRSTL